MSNLGKSIRRMFELKDEEIASLKAKLEGTNKDWQEMFAENKLLKARVEAKDEVIRKCRDNFELIADREDFTFAECSDAEEIISAARLGISQIDALLKKG